MELAEISFVFTLHFYFWERQEFISSLFLTLVKIVVNHSDSKPGSGYLIFVNQQLLQHDLSQQDAVEHTGYLLHPSPLPALCPVSRVRHSCIRVSLMFCVNHNL